MKEYEDAARATSADAARRSSRSYLAEHGIEENPNLPLIEEVPDLAPPAAPDVARRALVLNALIGRAYGADRALLDGYLRKNDLGDAVTPTERALLAKDRLARQERIDATWLVECVQVLAWGLGLVDLDHFRRCDDDLASNFPAPRDSARAFVAGARLRPFEEIHRQCDLLYCLHWAVTEARLRDRKGKLDGSVIRERHRAINWLAGVESRWDEVSTDT